MTSCRQVCERVLELKKQRPHTRASDVSVDFEFQSLVAVAAPKLAEALLIALEKLEFYAKGQHFEYCGLPENEPETASGEPTNWLCGGGEDHEYQYENGWAAREAFAAIDKIFGKAE